MKIKLNTVLKNYNGKPLTITDPETKEKKNLDLLEVFINSLNSVIVENGQPEQLKAADKARIYALSVRLYAKNEIDLDIDDRKLIKDRVDKTYGALIYGRVCEILEGPKAKEAPESDVLK